MKTRILSVLLVVAMLATMVVMPVYAADEYSTKEKCPHCGKLWTELETELEANTIAGTDSMTTQYVFSASGHYRLGGDLTSTSTNGISNMFGANAGLTIVLDMNGFSLDQQKSGRCFSFTNASKIYILNTSDAVSSLSNKQKAGVGGAIYAKGSGCVVNIYDITINDSSVTHTGYTGGIGLDGSSVVNMYSGAVIGAANGGSIGVVGLFGKSATFNMYGGTITGATGKYAISTRTGTSYGDQTINIEGGKVNGTVYVGTDNLDTIRVAGDPVVTNVDVTNGTVLTVGELTDGASIGVTAAAKTPFTNTLDEPTGTAYAADYFTSNVNDQFVKYDADTSALILDVATPIIQPCPHCNGEPATFVPYEHVSGGSLTEAGHYYLLATVSYSGSEFSVGSTTGDIVIDFHGKSVTNNNRAYSIKANCNVFMMDSRDKSVITGGHKSRPGSSIVVPDGSALTLYSGSYTQKEDRTNTDYGGVIHSSGNLTITGTAKVYGGKTNLSGGNIFAANGSNLTISGNAQVYGGTAAAGGADIYCAGADLTIGEDITGNIKLGMPASVFTFGGAVEKATYGAVTQNAGLTLTLDNVFGTGTAPIEARDGALYVGTGAATVKGDVKTWYNNADEAVAAYNEGNADYIIVGGADLALTGGEYIIDIYGSEINLTADAAATVYCYDSKNHAYKVYGSVTAGPNVTVKSLDDSNAEIADATAGSYILLENEGSYSVHALDIAITAIGLKTTTLKAGESGMYYYANYKCDNTLKGEIASYGIMYELYDSNGTAKVENTATLHADIINSAEGTPLVTDKDIAIGNMNGILSNDNATYSAAQLGELKINATPYVILANKDVHGDAKQYSLKDCCNLVDQLISDYNATGDTTTATNYTDYMNYLVNTVWADYDLTGWTFTNFNKAA